MRYNVSRTPNGIKVHLREEMKISTVAEDRDHLVQLIQPSHELEIDLAGLEEIDTAGVQLLVALRKEAISAGCDCHFSGCPESAMEAFGRLGLGSLLNEPILATGVRHGS